MKILYIPNRFICGTHLKKHLEKYDHSVSISGSCLYNKTDHRNKTSSLKAYLTNVDTLLKLSDIILIESVFHGVVPSLIHSSHCKIIPYIKGNGINSINALKVKPPIPKQVIKFSYISLLYRSSAIIYASNTIKNEYTQMFPKLLSKNDAIIPHSVSDFFFDLDVRHFSNDGKKILTVTNLNVSDKASSLELIIEAVSTLESQGYVLEIVGGGRYLNREKELFKKKYPYCNNIRWLGQLSHEDLNLLYNSSDIFLYHSTEDTCPTVIMEAQKTGLPVITTNSCGAKELVSKNGIIINPTIEELTANIVNLANDKIKRKKISIEAKNHVNKNLSWETSAKRINDFISNL